MTSSSSNPSSSPLRVIDLGLMAYAPAWEKQKQVHESLLNDAAAGPVLLLVEHDPVITLSQRKAAPEHLLASRESLAAMGIDVQPTDRGGDITYHGPGQLVAYPIIRLNHYGLNVGRYMRLLEQAVIDTLAEFDVKGETDPGATGVWINPSENPRLQWDGHPARHKPKGLNLKPSTHSQAIDGQDARPTEDVPPAKICAMGVRVRRNITLHGLALNVTTNLAHFATIVPCGLADRPVTSLQQILGNNTPSMDQVKEALVASFEYHLQANARA